MLRILDVCLAAHWVNSSQDNLAWVAYLPQRSVQRSEPRHEARHSGLV